MPHQGTFNHVAKWASGESGRARTFAIACAIVVAWGATGPLFEFSDTWQLIINTGTTIVTFLMVFLIQNTQNRDGEAIQIKLDELIRAMEGAHNVLLDLEELSEKELTIIKKRYERLAESARESLRSGRFDTDMPEVPEQ